MESKLINLWKTRIMSGQNVLDLYFSLSPTTLKLFCSSRFMLMFPPCCKSSSHTQECDGSHPCIHHYKWRLRGLRSDHAWVKVYHSPVTAIYLHTAPTLSLINEQGNVELLSVGGGIGWQEYTEIEGVC